jgi:hypothetical protein
LDGLVIISPFSKDRICCRTSEDLRRETMRLELLALRMIMDCGTEEEISDAKRAIETRFSSDACEDDDASSEDENSAAEDPWTRLKWKQSNNIRLTLPKTAGRREKRNLNAARVNSSPRSRSSGPVKRKELDAPRLSALSVARAVQLPTTKHRYKHIFVVASVYKRLPQVASCMVSKSECISSLWCLMLYRTRCGHGFRYVCLRVALEYKWECPECRAVITEDPIRIYSEEQTIRDTYGEWDNTVVDYSWDELDWPTRKKAK